MSALPPGHHFYQCSRCGKKVPNGSEKMVESGKSGTYVFICKEECEPKKDKP